VPGWFTDTRGRTFRAKEKVVLLQAKRTSQRGSSTVDPGSGIVRGEKKRPHAGNAAFQSQRKFSNDRTCEKGKGELEKKPATSLKAYSDEKERYGQSPISN